MFAAWGRFVHRFRWPVLAASVLVLVAFASVGFTFAGQTNDDTRAKTESIRASDLLNAEIPPQPGTSGATFLIVFRSESYTVADPRFGTEVSRALSRLRGDTRIAAIATPFESRPDVAPAMESRDGHEAMVQVTTKDGFVKARNYYPELTREIQPTELKYLVTGGLAINADFNRYLETDLTRAEYTSLPASLLLLLIVFATLVAALLPIAVGGSAVLAGVAGTLLLARYTDVSQYALNIVTLVGLGVAIDYSLFIVNRFREELRAGVDVSTAIETTTATAGRAVAFSGLTVAIGLGGMLFYPGTFLPSMGFAGSVVVALAVGFALTMLLALLSILGRRVERLRFRIPIGRAGFWHALATAVMRRPLVILLPVLAFLLLAASPFATIRIANGDQKMLPPQASSRRGLDQLDSNFPNRGRNTYVVVVHYLDGTGLTPGRIAALYGYARDLAGYRDVVGINSIVSFDPRLTLADYQRMLTDNGAGFPADFQVLYHSSVGKDLVTLYVDTNQATQSDGSFALLRKIRGADPPPGAEVLVTGATAFNADFISLIAADSPRAIGFVVVVTYVVLFLLVGSVLLPLKAVLTNLLSISASFGAIVWVFQQGHLATLLNFTPQPIDPVLPVIMFCIVFGLSMDYEVMLLSRIQEEYRLSGDNTRAVADGLERSGRLITGAAAIMIAVFLAFGLAQVLIIKAIGIGLALAVFIDATLMRMLIVPAVMRLLGRRNWWAPRPLALLHSRLGLAERPPAPEPA